MKKKRVVEGRERIKWSKKHGQDTYYGGCSDSGDIIIVMVEKMVCDSGDGVNQNKGKGKDSSRGKGKPQGKGKCAACSMYIVTCIEHHKAEKIKETKKR